MVNDFVMFIWITVVKRRSCRWRWRRIRWITDQATVGGRRAARACDVVTVVTVHAVPTERRQPNRVRHRRDFTHAETVQATRRERRRCLIFFWLANRVSKFRPTNLQHVNDEEDDEH